MQWSHLMVPACTPAPSGSGSGSGKRQWTRGAPPSKDRTSACSCSSPCRRAEAAAAPGRAGAGQRAEAPGAGAPGAGTVPAAGTGSDPRWSPTLCCFPPSLLLCWSRWWSDWCCCWRSLTWSSLYLPVQEVLKALERTVNVLLIGLLSLLLSRLQSENSSLIWPPVQLWSQWMMRVDEGTDCFLISQSLWSDLRVNTSWN